MTDSRSVHWEYEGGTNQVCPLLSEMVKVGNKLLISACSIFHKFSSDKDFYGLSCKCTCYLNLATAAM